jgi:hypothetical protein
MKAAFLGLLLCVLLFAGCSQKISEDEKALLIVAADLSDYGFAPSDPDLGVYSKECTSLYNCDIDYNYEAPEGSNESLQMFASEIQFRESESEAKKDYKDDITAYTLGVSLGSAVLEEQKDYIYLGDETFYGNLKKEGKIIGSTTVVRRKNRVYNVLIAGVYFGDNETLAEFMTPKLDLMEGFRGN